MFSDEYRQLASYLKPQSDILLAHISHGTGGTCEVLTFILLHAKIKFALIRESVQQSGQIPRQSSCAPHALKSGS